jgi:hypothetical protein
MGSIGGLIDFWHMFPTWHWCVFSNCAFSFSPWPPTHTRVEGKQTMINGFDLWIQRVPRQISPQPLHLSPTFKYLLKEHKISYPMHVSGRVMVEWVQRYACAKLSETIWLAGGWVFHGGAQKERKNYSLCHCLSCHLFLALDLCLYRAL